MLCRNAVIVLCIKTKYTDSFHPLGPTKRLAKPITASVRIRLRFVIPSESRLHVRVMLLECIDRSRQLVCIFMMLMSVRVYYVCARGENNVLNRHHRHRHRG